MRLLKRPLIQIRKVWKDILLQWIPHYLSTTHTPNQSSAKQYFLGLLGEINNSLITVILTHFTKLSNIVTEKFEFSSCEKSVVADLGSYLALLKLEIHKASKEVKLPTGKKYKI